MKPVASTMTAIDTMVGEEIVAKISADNAPFVIRSMADLYSNRELAVVREYSTNAYDSNVAKALRDGHEPEPIEVTLPNAMNPYFTVQDYGIGMSEEDMRETYLTFGDSTKRDSDDFNGMLGFGSKSAVAYTNTFTVTAVQNGIKTVGVVSRREDAMGGYHLTMKLVITGMPTSERDGVTVQVPVHNWREFEQKANDFYRFWQPNRVLVNGRAPQWSVGDRIDDNLYYATGYGESYVVMGNVPYKINNPDALFPPGMNRISFVAYVPIGDVEFVPAREALKYSDHTKNNLQKIISDFVQKSTHLAKNEINGAVNHAEAYKAWKKWRQVLGQNQVDDLTYKGDKLIDQFVIAGHRYDKSLYRYTTQYINKWYVEHMSQTIVITGFDINVATNHKEKVKKWAALKNLNARWFIFTKDKSVDVVWVPQERVVDWEQVKTDVPTPKKPRQQNIAYGRKAGTFDLISAANGIETEQDVPNTKELWYISIQDYNKADSRSSLMTLLKEFNMDDRVVKLPANRRDKFLRAYPHAKNIVPHFRDMVELDGMKLLSDEAKTYLATVNNERNILSRLDASKVDDPELAKTIKCFTTPRDDLMREYNKHERLARMIGVHHEFKRHPWEGYYGPDKKPLAKYPLAQVARDGKANEHVYIYINSVYAARQSGKQI